MDNTNQAKIIFSNPKKLFYLSICLISLISGFIFLITIKGNNRKFNQNLLTNANTLYINYLKNLNKGILENMDVLNSSDSNGLKDSFTIENDNNNYTNILNILKEFAEHKYLFPFKLNIISKEFEERTETNYTPLFKRIQVNQTESLTSITLNIFSIKEKELKFFISLITQFAIYEKKVNIVNEETTIPHNYTISYIPRLSEINIYKHVNLYFLIKQNEEKAEELTNIFSNLESISLGHEFNFFFKFLYYKSDYRELNLKDDILYEELKLINSKQIFEELNDENSINIIIHNNIKEKETIEVFYNKDINNDIYSFNFKQFNQNSSSSNKFSLIIKKLIEIKLLNYEIKKTLEEENESNSEKLLDIIIQINNSRFLNFGKLFVKSLDNLNKVNKIFGLYESIRTIDKIKEKFNYLQNTLIQIIKNNFNNIENKIISSFYINTKYLMESNELVSYEHYFSNEFKIGMFLPVMLPIAYGLIKSLKALTAAKSK